MSQPRSQPTLARWPGHGKAPSSVFHYTSSAGFLGMIQSGRLWATEAAGLNDYSEITAGQSFVRAHWSAVRAEFVSRYGAPPAELIDGVLSGAYPKLWVPGAEGAFVVCASKYKDDANQWRLYADDGRGFSVELDTEVTLEAVEHDILAAASGEPTTSAHGLVNVSGWRPVIYGNSERVAALDDLLAWIGSHRLSREATSTRHLLESLPADFAEGRTFNGLYQFIKTPGFAGENESRLVVTFADHADEYIGFRSSRTGIARVVHLQSTDRTSDRTNRTAIRPLPIRRVIMGPAQRHNLAAPAVRALLDRYGYQDVELTASEASLRWT